MRHEFVTAVVAEYEPKAVPVEARRQLANLRRNLTDRHRRYDRGELFRRLLREQARSVRELPLSQLREQPRGHVFRARVDAARRIRGVALERSDHADLAVDPRVR